VVGVNRFDSSDEAPIPVLEVDPALEENQREALRQRRESRDQESVTAALSRVGEVAGGDGNLMLPMRDALAAGATIGEVSDALREVFGLHRPTG
jgi:methylmalonyl-CoA mutase, N-terminal domain